MDFGLIDTVGTLMMPPAASTYAADVDALFYFIIYISIFFFVMIVGAMLYFAVRYRRKAGSDEIPDGPTHNTFLETIWIVVPVIIVMIIFFWGFRGYMTMSVVPANAMEIKVTGQQWFWTFAYPGGQITTNEMVVEVGKPIKLLMSSTDVIHALFIPAFRLKRDVLPNRYSITWFEATQIGDYHLFCAEYCGTSHAKMIGTVKVRTSTEFAEWLESLDAAGEGMSPAQYGEKLFTSRACITCHRSDDIKGSGPNLAGIFGHEVNLADGTKITADENYIRESILDPMSKVVAGYQPVMPTFQGILKEKEVDALVAYVKSLGGQVE